jgi:hypothetical protein
MLISLPWHGHSEIGTRSIYIALCGNCDIVYLVDVVNHITIGDLRTQGNFFLHGGRHTKWMTQTPETKITISGETWRRLNVRKREPGETFDDVVQRLLSDSD